MYYLFHQSHDHRCEPPPGSVSPSCPIIPSASPFQLQYNHSYSLPVNPPPLPPPAQPIQPPPDYSLQEAASSQLPRPTENETPSTPSLPSSIRSLTTPPFQQPTHLASVGVTLQRPGIFSMQQPPEPVIRPQAIPNPQFVQISGRRAPCSRFIVKIGLVGTSLGKIVSKYKIPGSYWHELTCRECYGILYTSISK